VADGPVRLERDGPLAVVTFDSPPLNLFTRAMGQGVEDVMNELEAEPPRALLFRADGKVVTGGVDVHLFKERAERGGEADDGVRGLLEQNRRIEALPYPTLFAAHSLCLTWAFELALACDLLPAADKASFGLVERRVGLAPGAGGRQRLAERAGPARAREFVYTGEIYSAETLERWNVVNRVYPDEGFDAAARAFATELANGPTIAHGATKRIVRAYLEGGVAGADAVTDDQFGELFASEDLRNAVETFLTEGPDKATFSGR